MKVSRRFQLSVHTILFIAVYGDEKGLTCDYISNELKCNPIVIKNIFCSDDLQINNPIISDLPELLVTPFEKVMSCIKDTLSKVSIDSLLKQYNY